MFLFIAIDQISKIIIRLFGGFYICNKGIAFGFQINSLFFWIIWVALIITLILFLKSTTKKLPKIAILFILSGSLSNGLDRIIHGCVIDFINLPYWPHFNLADTIIVVGAIIILLGIFLKKK